MNTNAASRGIYSDQSDECFRVAAAAIGPITAKNNVSAANIRNGGRKGSGSATAPRVAATPNISTGMTKGRTMTETSSPPRGNETVSAAPAAPMNVIAGVPTRSVRQAAACPSVRHS